MGLIPHRTSSRDLEMRHVSETNRARVLASAHALIASGRAAGIPAISRDTGLATATVCRHLRDLRAAGLVPPAAKGGREDWARRRTACLAAIDRLARSGREVTAASVASEMGVSPGAAGNLLSRLRAAGLVARPAAHLCRHQEPARAPAPRPATVIATVWPPGPPEGWEPAIACLYYRREFRARNRRRAS